MISKCHSPFSREGLRIIKDKMLFDFLGDISIVCGISDIENSRKLRKLKDAHKGDRCFIVGTGPSLRIEDVEKLRNEFTFSVNSIFMLYNKTDWRSTYYVCLDERHLKKMAELYPDRINQICTDYKFLNQNEKRFLSDSGIELDKDLYIRVSGINNLLSLQEKFYFTTDIVRGIYSAGTVTNIAIIIAMHMGFKDIYLLGVDCNYSGKIRHFSKDWNDVAMQLSEKELIELRMKNGFEKISDVTKKYDVNIWNATRGGMLESFLRVDFDSIEFKDNI